MNTSLLAMAVAIFLTLGLVVGLGALSLTTGGLIFLFGRPRLGFLKSSKSDVFVGCMDLVLLPVLLQLNNP